MGDWAKGTFKALLLLGQRDCDELAASNRQTASWNGHNEYEKLNVLAAKWGRWRRQKSLAEFDHAKVVKVLGLTDPLLSRAA